MSKYIYFYLFFFFIIINFSYITKANGEEDSEVKNNRKLTDIIYRKDEEVSVYSLRLERYILAEALLVYTDFDSAQVLIPFNVFLSSIEFPIEFDISNNTASGWFVSENQTFQLDLNTGLVKVNGIKKTITAKNVELHEDDLYVDIKTLEKWFPIILENNTNEQIINVEPILPIPMQIRIEKEQKRKKISSGQRKENINVYYEEPPFFSWPSINFNTQNSYSDGDFKLQSTLLASGLFAKQHSRLRVNNSPDKTLVKFTLEDKNTENDLFGLMGTEYALGDINTYSIPLVSNGVSGRGLYYSTSPFSAQNSIQSGQAELRGELPVGYEVDLLQNGQLIGFQDTQNEQGEYLFIANVRPGINIFEFIFYGPQGQRFTKEEKYFIPVKSIGDGDFGTKINIVQANTNLFDNEDNKGNERIEIQGEYGINYTSTLYGALINYEAEKVRKSHGVLRFSHSVSGVRTDYSFAFGDQQDYGLGLRLQGINYGLNWDFEYQNIEKLESEYKNQLSSGFDISEKIMAGVSGIIPVTGNIPFYLNFEGLFASGKYKNIIDLNISKPLRNYRVTTKFLYKTQGDKDDFLEADTQFYASFNNFNIRGGGTFNVLPKTELQSIDLAANYLLNSNDNLNLNYHYNENDQKISTGYSHSFDYFSVGLSSSYSLASGFNFNLNFNFSLGVNPITNDVFVTSENLVGQGGIVAHVYLDKNENGLLNKRENKIEGVRFVGDYLFEQGSTDVNGIHYFYGVKTYSQLKLEPDPTSLGDISLYSNIAHSDYTVKPSQLLHIDFPVVRKGEVDGQVYKQVRGDRRAGESIEFNLVSWRTGSIVAEIKSEYDGFILFKNVPEDKYFFEAKASQIESLQLCQPVRRQIIIDENNAFVSVDPIYIFERNPIGNVDVLFWKGNDHNQGLAHWEKMKTIVNKVIFSRKENAFSYLRNTTENQWELVFDNVTLKDAKKYCVQLKSNNLQCDIITTESDNCPSQVINLKQVKPV